MAIHQIHANHEYIFPRTNLPFWYQNFNNHHAEYVAPHWHKALEMLYVYEGRVTGFMIDDCEYTLQSGQMVVVPPEAIHAINTPPMFHKSVSIQFPYKMISDLYPKIRLRRFIMNEPDSWGEQQKQAFPQLQVFLKEIYELTAQPLIGAENIHITALIYQVLYYLVKYFTVESRRTSNRQDDTLIENLTNYIDQHFQETISLDQLAHQLSYSKDYLERRFKETTGTTIHKYIVQQRTREAYHNLQLRDAPLYVVASESGFQSLRSMNRALAAYYQKTAKQIRQEK